LNAATIIYASAHGQYMVLLKKRLIKNVVCSYRWSRLYVQHDLAESAKVEFSSSPPARLKEPGSAPRLFQFNATFQRIENTPTIK